MFQILIAQAKTRIALAAKSAVCGVIAAATVLIAICFLVAAGLIWLAERYGSIEACLIMGGVFLAIAAAAIVAMLIIRRRPPPRPRVNATLGEGCADPQALAAGVEILRLLGGRRAAAIGVVGAFVVGLLLSHGIPKK